jgi:hypothetical protein
VASGVSFHEDFWLACALAGPVLLVAASLLSAAVVRLATRSPHRAPTAGRRFLRGLVLVIGTVAFLGLAGVAVLLVSTGFHSLADAHDVERPDRMVTIVVAGAVLSAVAALLLGAAPALLGRPAPEPTPDPAPVPAPPPAAVAAVGGRHRA